MMAAMSRFDHLLLNKQTVIWAALTVLPLYILLRLLYNVFLHPLARFPGPRLACATRLYYDWCTVRGLQARQTRQWHERYGSVVRVTPDQLSFTHPQAWRDIYMHKQGRRQLQKSGFLPVQSRANNLLEAPDDVHARQRKMLSYAFSDRSLRKQESMIQQYVDRLVLNLRNDAATSKPANLVQAFNHMTFDVIGDFAFGESFHMLESRSNHPFIRLLFDSLRAFTTISAFANSTSSHGLFKKVIPWIQQHLDFDHTRFAHEKVSARIAAGEISKPDLITNILHAKQDHGDELPREEIDAIALAILVAGSETTSTELSGMTYLLLKHRHVLHKLQIEIRSAFSSADDIQLLKVNQLPYLSAVIEESLRLYPPVPTVLNRITPTEGAIICDEYIPGQTLVGIPFYANNLSTRNWARALDFVPDRWLADAPAEYRHDVKSALQPFSAGPRNCIGKNLACAEMRLTMANIIFNFDMELIDPEDDWLDQFAFTAWQKKPLMVKLVDRFA